MDTQSDRLNKNPNSALIIKAKITFQYYKIKSYLLKNTSPSIPDLQKLEQDELLTEAQVFCQQSLFF